MTEDDKQRMGVVFVVLSAVVLVVAMFVQCPQVRLPEEEAGVSSCPPPVVQEEVQEMPHPTTAKWGYDAANDSSEPLANQWGGMVLPFRTGAPTDQFLASAPIWPVPASLSWAPGSGFLWACYGLIDPSSDTLISIAASVDCTGSETDIPRLVAALYDAGGNLLGNTAQEELPLTYAGWWTLDLLVPVALTPGAEYALAVGGRDLSLDYASSGVYAHPDYGFYDPGESYVYCEYVWHNGVLYHATGPAGPGDAPPDPPWEVVGGAAVLPLLKTNSLTSGSMISGGAR